jgi:hypothetical protein
VPIVTTNNEMGLLFNGKTDSISRWYATEDSFPHKVGEYVFLAVDRGEGRLGMGPNVYAAAIVKSVRPSAVESRFDDDEVARSEGYSCAGAWRSHFEQMYGPVRSGVVFHIQFQIKEMNDAAMKV